MNMVPLPHDHLHNYLSTLSVEDYIVLTRGYAHSYIYDPYYGLIGFGNFGMSLVGRADQSRETLDPVGLSPKEHTGARR